MSLSQINKKYIVVFITMMWLVIPFLILFKIDSFYISTLFSFNIVITFVVGGMYILHISDVLGYLKKEVLVQFLTLFGYIVGILFVYSFLQREHFIYYWDFSAYWNTSIEFNKLMNTDFIASIKQIYASILRDDYSVFPSVLLSFPLKFLGESYTSYILAIYTIFLYPSSLILFFLGLKISEKINLKTKLNTIIIFILSFTFPIMIAPMLGGYLDSVGMIFVSLSLIILFNNRFDRLNLRAVFLLSACFVLLAFTRRWYAFWIVSCFVSIGISYVLKWAFDRNFTFKQLLMVILNFFIVGSSSALFLILFFNEFIRRSLTNNFQSAYSAYYFGDIFSNLKTLFSHYGFFVLLLAFIGFIALLLIKQTKYISIFLVTNITITYFLFLRIQSFASQHYYLLTANILILFFCGVILTLNYLSNFRNIKRMTLAIIIYFVASNFLVTFTNINSPSVTMFSSLLSDFKQTPRVRTDIETLKKMTLFLKEVSTEKQRIYVLSSSGILNDDILRQIEMPENKNALPFMNLTHHVDLRDGFPESFFTSEFIVLSTPVQYHLDESGQKVIGILAEELLNGILKDNFTIIKSYQLDNGVTSVVMRKVSPINKEEIENIRSEFKGYYPNNPIF